MWNIFCRRSTHSHVLFLTSDAVFDTKFLRTEASITKYLLIPFRNQYQLYEYLFRIQMTKYF